MRQSHYFLKTSKTTSKDDVSVNARMLEQGSFIYKNSAGIYTYLPLGWRVLQKIAQIIREEMNAISGQEMFMPALHDKHYLQATGRWDVDVVFKVVEGDNKEPNFNISWTHEEIIAEIASRFVNSYKDLPFAIYQIQTKFRNEPRAKSGLLRGREFMMKDLYSFHTTEAGLMEYYEQVADAYSKIFERCGLKAFRTLAAGGEFTMSNTDEFQVFTDVGEDTTYYCAGCSYAMNEEVAFGAGGAALRAGDACPKCGKELTSHKSVEVGNIFPLGTKYSEAFDLKFTDDSGNQQFVMMGSYGIGLGRLMGTVVEVFHDDNGIIWPESIAPFKAHLIAVTGKDGEDVVKHADNIYQELQAAGIEVLYDDRKERSTGEKFADSDLIGIPYRIVVSTKTLAENSVELKKRTQSDTELVPLDAVTNYFTNS
jgi:prolyl-tRNA synthetase